MVDVDRLGVLAWPTGCRLNPLLSRIGRSYAAWRVERDLDGMHVGGHVALQQALEAGPVLIVANHVAWWDGLVALALGQALGAEWGWSHAATRFRPTRGCAASAFFRCTGA